MPIKQTDKLTALKGVGQKTADLFAKKGILTVQDLLQYYPRDYDWFDVPLTIDQLQPGKVAAVRLVIVGNGSTVHAGRYRITSFRAGDATGQLRLTYFNMPYLQKTIRAGSVHVFRGLVRQQKNGTLVMEQASVYTPEEYAAIQTTFLPRYPLFQGVTNAQLIRLMRTALRDCEPAADYIPAEDLADLQLLPEEAAVRGIHFPDSRETMTAARNRKVFDEFLAFLLTVKSERAAEAQLVNERPMVPSAETARLIEALPYELTAGQRQAWQDIEEDLCSTHIMNRLLQGDVGSGKTILAFLALLLCACNGRQGALMAPTEVLAEQHMEKIEAMRQRYDLPLHPLLLTGAVKGKARTDALKAILSGEANVIIGTHALIQDKVQYYDLGLVVTDEQHRFGVRQREALAGKGTEVPVLVMSATPIPRTLAIILYGDLSVSQLRELPANRKPIRNLAIGAEARPRVYKFIWKQLQEGRQAYVICPAVGEKDSEEDGAPGAMYSAEGPETENVTDYTEKLRKVFPPSVRIEMLHGRMKPADKNRIMEEFSRHNIDILVSTTVIEVGIDVPNASVILIENAEHFGLSQLHQLRGRVGRGEWQSYCIFMYSAGIEEKPKRLQVLEKTNDGFAVAEEDLKLRGPGDLFGTRQSGELGFQLGDIYADAGILTKAAAYADRLLSEKRTLALPARLQLDLRSI